MHLQQHAIDRPPMNLRVQAFTPSDHLCSVLLLPNPPQFLYQAPPGAQQLTLPDFRNVPHFGHVIVLAIVGVAYGVLTDLANVPHFGHVIVLAVTEVTGGVLSDVLIGVLTMSSRSGIGRRDTYWRVPCVVAVVHSVRDMDPDEPVNMSTLVALDRTHAAPHSFCLNDRACSNIESMLATLDTSQFEMSRLNCLACMNMRLMSVTLDTFHFEISPLNGV